MTAITFKLGPKDSREFIATILPLCPWYSKSAFEALLERIESRGVEVKVAKIQQKHTDSQRGYYHLCVDLLAKHLGMSHDAMHDQALIEWAGSTDITIGNRIVQVPLRRSAKLGVQEYGELIEALLRISAFCDFPLPEPSEVA